MDERASQHASDDPRAKAADIDQAAVSEGTLPGVPAMEPAHGDHADLVRTPTGGSSVRRHTVDRAGGSSRTRTFAAASGDEAVVATDIEGGSTARRSQGPVGRLENQPTVISKQPPTSLTPPTGHLQPAEMGRVLQGEKLGHFELLEFVGGGGMGAVFRALDTMLNRIVAVKVLSHEQSDDEETLRRFKNEAQSAARLDHENIGRVHYVGEDGGWHYIVFEFIEGINLRDLVERDGPLAVADAVSFMLQLGDALAHAARRDVVHRDIKPSNVLITPEGKAKLVDMGLARLHQVEHANNDLTASGVTLGTFDYISPEQARDPRSADVRSDLYSLGCTFYYMLAGRPPFPDGTVLQKLLQHQGDEPPDVRQFCLQLPDDLYRILKRLLAKLPGDRYQDPGELVSDLTAAAVRLGLRPVSPGSMVWLATATQERAQWQRTLPWLAPIAALVMIVAVLNVIWTPHDSAAPPLLGRLPRPEIGSPANAAVAADLPIGKGVRRLESERPATGKATAEERTNNHSEANADRSPLPQDDPINTTPWTESLLSGIFAMWNTVRSDDIAARLTAAHQNLRLPFPMSPRLKDAMAVPAESSSAPTAATHAALVVAGTGARSGEYASLAAAVREAKNGDVIELRYDGVLNEEPLNLANLKLTIRAASKRTPIVHFGVDNDDVLAERRSMVNLDGGQLTLHNVRLGFTLPRDMTDHWSLFEVGHADELRFQGCIVTVRNAGQGANRPTATMINVRAGLADGSGMMQDAMPVAEPVKIVAEQSIFRGEATFLQFAKARPVELRLEKVLIALSERLVEGDVGLMNARGVSDTRIELRHVTLLAESGLVRLTNDTAASPAPGALESPAMRVEVECVDSILAGGPSSAMIEQVGSETYQRLGGQLNWSGDRSFYDGFSPLWRIIGSGALQEYNSRQWQDFWRLQENQTAASTGYPNFPVPADRPLHDIGPSDFLLFDDSPALNFASKGGDAGAVLHELPSPERAQLREE
jgi:serine/threonine protein kinase